MDDNFYAECHIFNREVYPGDVFFTMVSQEVYGDDNKLIGYHYSVHITKDDKTTNKYREQLLEYRPKVVMYHREPEAKELWKIDE